MPTYDIDAIKAQLRVADLLATFNVPPPHSGVINCPLPTHSQRAESERTPSFSIYDNERRWKCWGSCDANGDVIDLAERLGNLAQGDAIAYCANLAGVADDEPNVKPEPVTSWKPVWDATTADTGRLYAYLKHRGLSGVVPPALRLHPALPYYCQHDKANTGRLFPTMVAKVTNAAGAHVALHRIYLDNASAGKAPVAAPKQALAPHKGCYVALGKINTHVGVAEGIETGLAVQEALSLPVVAAITSSNMPNILLPERVTTVYIFVDLDASGVGLRKAKQLATNLYLQGRKVFVLAPTTPDCADYLDVLNEGGGDDMVEQLAKTEPFVDDPSTRDFVQVSTWLDVPLPKPREILEGVLPVGCKGCIVGDSKIGKSMLTLQMAMCAVCGREFLGLNTTASRVTILQMEIPAFYFQERIKWMLKPLKIRQTQLANLWVRNMRGTSIKDRPAKFLVDAALRTRADLLIIDPFYKLMNGDEKEAMDVAPLLAAFDEVCERTGAALILIHHTPKGFSSERSMRDRPAGSSILMRDVDTGLFLGEHEYEGLVVMENMNRCFEGAGARTIGFNGDGIFERLPHIPPALKGPGKQKPKTMADDIDPKKVLSWLYLHGQVESKGKWIELLGNRGLSRRCARAVLDSLVETSDIVLHIDPHHGNAQYFGTPDQMHKYLNPSTKQDEADDLV